MSNSVNLFQLIEVAIIS